MPECTSESFQENRKPASPWDNWVRQRPRNLVGVRDHTPAWRKHSTNQKYWFKSGHSPIASAGESDRSHISKVSRAIRRRSITRGSHRRRRRCLFAFVFAFLAVVILGGWMVVELWMIPFASKLAEEELAKRGYHVTYKDPDLTLWNARLRLEDLTLHRSSQKDEPLIFVSDLGVDIDLRSLIWKRTLSGRGSIRRGNVIVFGKDRQPDFRKLAADIEFNPDGIRIARFTGESNLGYQLNLVGTIGWSSSAGQSEAQPDAPSGAETRKRGGAIGRAIP